MAPKRKCAADVTLDIICPIDLELMEDEVTLPCSHYMCWACWEKTDKTRCPICRYQIESTWVPNANKPLRQKIKRVKREARCGKFFTLTDLCIHRAECKTCILEKLKDVVMENKSLENRIIKLERQVVDANDTIHLMRRMRMEHLTYRVAL